MGSGGGWGIKENDEGGVNSTMIYFKNFCKCHKHPQYNNNKKRRRNKNRESFYTDKCV
jgi:hypothetical protein